MSEGALEALSLIVAIAVWWLGIRKIELGSLLKSVISALEIGLLVAAVATLGWTGLAIFAGANVIGVLAHSARLKMRQETILVGLANRTGATKQQAYASHKQLLRVKELKWIGPIELATWMREIAFRGRDLDEIEAIAPVIGKLSLIYDRPDPEWLISKFDQILRLYDEPASRAEQVAETLHASVNASATTFREMVEACITAVSPPSPQDEVEASTP